MKKLCSLTSRLAVLIIPSLLLGLILFTQAKKESNYIHIVGSSTVFPFVALAAEKFTRTSAYPSPLVERNGTGLGIKLFCAGVGAASPDLVNASRQIKASELASCAANGVTQVEELFLGRDGIVIAQAKQLPSFPLTSEQLYLALAAEIFIEGQLVANPHQTWQEVAASLPARPIHVLGPSGTAGTYDVFVELVMQAGAKASPEMAALAVSDHRRFEQLANNLRNDGAYVAVGENDNMVIQKLNLQPKALGIIGFSFYEKNCSELEGISLNGVKPSWQSLSDSSYLLARPLFLYIKRQHQQVTPGLALFVDEIKASLRGGENSYLVREGLIVAGMKRAAEAKCR